MFNVLMMFMCWHMLISEKNEVRNYKNDISIKEYVTQLKFRHINLLADEIVLRESFQPSAEKSLLFASMCFVQALDSFNEVFEFMNPNLTKCIKYAYTGPICTYFLIKKMKYIFVMSDLRAIERELKGLQVEFGVQ